MIRILVTLYHIAIALLAVGLLLALFIVVTYVLSDALLWYFFEIDINVVFQHADHDWVILRGFRDVIGSHR